MSRFSHLAWIVLAATMLGGCPETTSCPEGQRYSETEGCVGNADGGGDGGLNGRDSGPDAGPCGGECDLEHCDVSSGRCLECLGDVECTTSEAPVCTAGECGECTTDEQCTRLGLHECHEGACVDCTPDTEEAICTPTFVCLPDGSCSDSDVRGSVGPCGACVADSHCAVGYDCVPMNFAGTPREGAYCLRRMSLGCSRPYGVPITARTTLSGVTGETYCGINEALTTCEAVLAFAQECASGLASDCTSAPGAICGVVGGIPNTCTYPCTDALQCDSSRLCPDASDYCGGPAI
ncbi:hypothetical protein [Sandaracinus amylolyticus]|uniref:hypothetical protein n=1 Tax=Sandaracinus amylolyticus TaxID=927083 RepID=UPI001F238E07|nr:hypothetical protein [Sandaracinus amylolyticus]UJR80845.1 Hypothetical protein I5071_28950 [Sandaracinus amylolyticus]